MIGDALGGAAEMLHILRVRRERRTREPLMITEAWLPADLSHVLTAPALRRTPLYELLSGPVLPSIGCSTRSPPRSRGRAMRVC